MKTKFKNWRSNDEVNYHSIIGGKITSSGHKIREICTDSNGNLVAFITGIRGYVAIEALSKS